MRRGGGGEHLQPAVSAYTYFQAAAGEKRVEYFDVERVCARG